MRVLSLSLSAQHFCHYLPFVILACLILHTYDSFCTLIKCYQSNDFSCPFCYVVPLADLVMYVVWLCTNGISQLYNDSFDSAPFDTVSFVKYILSFQE